MPTHRFEYTHDDTVLAGQLARPAGPGPHPAVLVMHDALGMGSLVRRRAEQLAAAGYVALATDMYGTGGDIGDQETSGALFMGLQETPARLRARVVASFAAVQALPDVDPSRVAAIGYCFGGQCVLELARSGADVRAVVSFHGLLTTALPARPGAVQAQVLAITGALDPYAPHDHVAGFQAEMAAAGAAWQLTVYGQGFHAFSDPEVGRRDDIPGLRYDALLDRLSWAQASALLEAALAG